ncbi:DNA-binding NarL/FixJ family response regulator [Xanthomonas sacchari]|uniref:response regulator n=1 Tax=unclassified Xanthomonas TaxID=2643310 RepID=UPI001369D967|nr:MULTISPECIES: response regulator transcription factor [unclassified Xanthomonas]MBB6366689.1 DNA-binding NarL/FixJ family response regulator [Xanthomonas sp. F10]MXV34070.1 DNA-binding response regulator [Xanthomonas sp. LMG 8989]
MDWTTNAGPAGHKGTGPVDGRTRKVFIADDHPSATFAVLQLLSTAFAVPGSHCLTFHGSAELLAACADSPDGDVRLVVLDLLMPGKLKRVRLVQAVMQADPTAQVVIYTAEESAFLASAVFRAGALGYVAKTSAVAELAQAIEAVGSGGRYLDRNIDLDSIKAHPWTSLTEAERSILLAFSRGEKAAEIGERTGRSYSTVTTHKYSGLAKLGLRDGSDLLPYLYANGLHYELDEPHGQ